MLTERLVVVKGRGREGRGRSEFISIWIFTWINGLYLDIYINLFALSNTPTYLILASTWKFLFISSDKASVLPAWCFRAAGKCLSLLNMNDGASYAIIHSRKITISVRLRFHIENKNIREKSVFYKIESSAWRRTVQAPESLDLLILKYFY